MSDVLKMKKCIPCEGGVKPLEKNEIDTLLKKVNDWKTVKVDDEERLYDTLQKRFVFKNFREAMAFLREVEELAESQGHHPDFCVHYNKVDFSIWTHAIAGLHENDFIIAAGIDRLAENFSSNIDE
jgi:4a-hydroxytetrahydrobiopterin dehydratase